MNVENRDPLAPPLRWVGGKTWALPTLFSLMHAADPHRTRLLVEPFAGGAALSWAWRPNVALLCDAVEPLIHVYRAIQQGHPFVPRSVYCKEAYQTLRDQFNERVVRLRREGVLAATDGFDVEVAEGFWMLNKTCFNGLCRFNREGRFNTPWGERMTYDTTSPSQTHTFACRGWTFRVGSGLEMEWPRESVVFLDPPYLGGFTSYGGERWTPDHEERLVERATHHDGGVLWMGSVTPERMNFFASPDVRRRGWTCSLLKAKRGMDPLRQQREFLAWRGFAFTRDEDEDDDTA